MAMAATVAVAVDVVVAVCARDCCVLNVSERACAGSLCPATRRGGVNPYPGAAFDSDPIHLTLAPHTRTCYATHTCYAIHTYTTHTIIDARRRIPKPSK